MALAMGKQWVSNAIREECVFISIYMKLEKFRDETSAALKNSNDITFPLFHFLPSVVSILQNT
jgi:hypothetical protein